MPKGHKRKKNPGVGIDFRKAKHKVGRKLPKAQNETDTTVKSQKLVLAEQSVGVDKSGLATTSRNNTLKELLSQCSHYSERVRLKALHGLIDLLREYPSEARHHASEIVATTAMMASDSLSACRDAYCVFLRSALFPALGENALQPFLPYLMGHICSAMTHLSHGIRKSGIEMMNVVLEWRPDVVGQQYFADICQHFIESLGKSSRGRSLSAGSLKNLLSLVEGCHIFLKSTLPYMGLEYDSHDNESLSNVANMTTSKHRNKLNNEKKSHILLQWRKCHWDFSRRGKISANDSSVKDTRLAANLFGILLECWEECGLTSTEVIFAREIDSIICGSYILQSCTLLISKFKTQILLEESVKSANAERIFTRIFPFFPSCGSGRGELSRLDAIAAKMIATTIVELRASRYCIEEDIHATHATEVLVKWCSLCFERSSSDPSAFSLGVTIAENMLLFSTPSLRQTILSGMFKAWSAIPVDSDDRNKGLNFMCEIFRPPLISYVPLDDDTYSIYHGIRKVDQVRIINRESDDILSKMISEVPSFLWKIRKAPTRNFTFRLGLSLMLNASRFINMDSKVSFALPSINRELEDLTSKIIPLFAIKIKGKLIPGPLCGMPEDLQALAIDILYHLPGLNKNIVRLISDCVEMRDVLSLDMLDKLFELIYLKSQYGDPEEVWSLIYSVMKGFYTPHSNEKKCIDSLEWDYEMFLLNRISRIALHCSPPSLALQSILPPILKETSSLSPEARLRSLYGALYFLHQCLLLNIGVNLDIPADILDKVIDVCATLQHEAELVSGGNVIKNDIDRIARESIKLLSLQTKSMLGSVIKYTTMIDCHRLKSAEVILEYLLGALDSFELGTDALELSNSAHLDIKQGLVRLQSEDKYPKHIRNLALQIKTMYETIVR